jgi:hypothetical protein
MIFFSVRSAMFAASAARSGPTKLKASNPTNKTIVTGSERLDTPGGL